MNWLRRAANRCATLGLLLAALLPGCQGGDDLGTPALCPTCDPFAAGGDTGDFGGISTDIDVCAYVRRGRRIDVASAERLGFDMEQLERAIARPIDAPLRWRVQETVTGEPATGYEENTRLVARLQSTGSVRYVDLDPAYCDGTRCRRFGAEILQASCVPYIELGLRAELRTLDGAIRATTEGRLQMQLLDQSGPRSAFQWFPRTDFWTQVDLSRVYGTLRLMPPAGARRYLGELSFNGSLSADGCSGTLEPSLVHEEASGQTFLYDPVWAAFPAGPSAADARGPSVGQDAARRAPP